MTGRTAWQLTLHINVLDPAALRGAAVHRLTADGASAEQIYRQLGPARRPRVNNCLLALNLTAANLPGASLVDTTLTGGDPLD